MEETIRIAEPYRARVAQILEEELALQDPGPILADGKIDKTEFYRHREAITVFPQASLLAATPAARYLNDRFFEEAGLDEDFFVDLYDETFDDAAGAGGDSTASIDSDADVAALRQRIKDFVKAGKAAILEELREGIGEWASGLIQKGDVRVRCGDDHIVHVTITKTGSIPIEPLKVIFFDRAHDLLPRLAKQLFVRNDKVVLKEPAPEIAATDLIRGGFTVHSEIYASMIPNREAYVHMTVRSETTPDGRRRYVISMHQLSRLQEQAYRLPKPDHRMGSLTGAITLTETEDGGTAVEMKVDANPDLTVIPDWLISSFPLGVPGQLLDASRSVASHAAVQVYYQKCLVKRTCR